MNHPRLLVEIRDAAGVTVAMMQAEIRLRKRADGKLVIELVTPIIYAADRETTIAFVVVHVNGEARRFKRGPFHLREGQSFVIKWDAAIDFPGEPD